MPLIFPYPQGTNDLESLDAFDERLVYKQASFSTTDVIPLDMIYEKPFYGKVDKDGNAIYPTEINMVQIPGSGLLLLHDFVAKAFKELSEMLNIQIRSKNKHFAALFPNGFRAVSATKNFHVLYQTHFVSNVYNVFLNDYISSTSRKRHLRNFEDFIDYFVSFSFSMQDQFPITKTGFIMSPQCPNEISGLIVDVDGSSKEDDSVKYENYLSKAMFRNYLRFAASFGFYVDKNCPWRLAANLDHPTMTEKYMAAFGTSYNNNSVFEDYFYKSEHYSYEDFKSRMWYGYKQLLVDEDTTSYGMTAKVKNCMNPAYADILSHNYRTVFEEGFLEEISDDYDGEFQADYPDLFFLPPYFKIRLAESGKNLSEQQYNAKLKKILDVYKMKVRQGSKMSALTTACSLIEKVTKQSHIYVANKSLQYPARIKYFGDSITSDLHSYEEDDKIDANIDVLESEVFADGTVYDL